MSVLSTLPIEPLQTVGAVLLEAVVLYVGYGALTSAVEPRVRSAINDR